MSWKTILAAGAMNNRAQKSAQRHFEWLSAMSVLVVFVLWVDPSFAFDFKPELSGETGTLGASVESINTSSGEVTINGGDVGSLSSPFEVDWGDGSPVEAAWFPFQHTYTDTAQNFLASVTSNYTDGSSASVGVVVRFTSPVLTPIFLPAERAVTIDNEAIALTSRPYPGYTPPTLTFFDDSFFSLVPRSAVEYVLHVAAELQYQMANGDVFEVDGAFHQHVLRDPNFGGMYSIWFSNPVAFGAGDYAFGGTIQYSSFFHEMGHNVSLNSPAAFHYGGRIDGNANAIFSETMAQIFAHATAYHIINNHDELGLEAALTKEIELSARASISGVRVSYDEFVASGAPFTSWNDPSTGHDETFNTFMTLAYKFFEKAELAGNGYTAPLMRMMKLLQLFDADMAASYAQFSDTPEAETYRSTLLVAALSYAFEIDLRAEMQALNFPIDTVTYEQLIALAEGCNASLVLNCLYSGDPQSFIDRHDLHLNGVVEAPEPCPDVNRIEWEWGDGVVSESWFPATHTYTESGEFSVTATALDVSDEVLAEDSCEVVMPFLDSVEEPIDPFLATPAINSLWDIPVVILRYLPTRDGVSIDTDATGWSSSLDDLKTRIDTFTHRVKFMLEEGSIFRGYGDSPYPPSIGYKVIKIITVYEEFPKGVEVWWNPGWYRPDFNQILDRFDGQHYVEDLGVKEFWIWGYHFNGLEPTESNMASPLTGDISNSERYNDDMPVYSNTYTVYNYNFTRTQAEAVHNHGHQLEALLSYANGMQDGNTDLFWKTFVGQDSEGQWQPGRCGWTHMPPNTIDHYDYLNPAVVQSDCEDWKPAGGKQTDVSVLTWQNLDYGWPDNGDIPQKPESQFYIYWMQNMPGFDNQIPYAEDQMTNWWYFTADWDSAITDNYGLYGEAQPSEQIFKDGFE